MSRRTTARRFALGAVLLFACTGDDQSSATDATTSAATEGSTTAATAGSTAGTTNGTTTDGTATAGTGSAGSTVATAATSGESESASTGDPCDCPNGAYVPVCGIDGQTYDATCGTACVGVVIACAGECPCAGTPCGPMTCAGPNTICTVMTPGDTGGDNLYACAAPPAACLGMLPTCACASDNQDCTCEEPMGAVTITCPGA